MLVCFAEIEMKNKQRRRYELTARRGKLICASIACLALMARASVAADDESGERAAAKVNGAVITVSDVERAVKTGRRGKKVTANALLVLQAETLKQLVDKQLVLAFLEKQKLAASKKEVDLDLERLRKRLADRSVDFQDYLKKAELNDRSLNELLRWQISWRRFLERYLTDKNLQRFFDQRKADYDGRKLKVAHILFKPGPNEAVDAGRQDAANLRDRIRKKEISFADAARQFSQSPSAKKGGEIGEIARREPMPEPFSKAAFALPAGDVSEPVVTPFGVHLIHVLEIAPGQLRWVDVRDHLERDMREYLFRWAADQQRGKIEVEFTGAVAYFEPETSKLIFPRRR